MTGPTISHDALKVMAEHCVDIAAAGQEPGADHPLTAEIEALDGLSRTRLQWFAAGAGYERFQHLTGRRDAVKSWAEQPGLSVWDRTANPMRRWGRRAILLDPTLAAALSLSLAAVLFLYLFSLVCGHAIDSSEPTPTEVSHHG